MRGYDGAAENGMSMHPMKRGAAIDIVAPRWLLDYLDNPYKTVIVSYPRMAGRNYITEQIRKAIEGHESSNP